MIKLSDVFVLREGKEEDIRLAGGSIKNSWNIPSGQLRKKLRMAGLECGPDNSFFYDPEHWELWEQKDPDTHEVPTGALCADNYNCLIPISTEAKHVMATLLGKNDLDELYMSEVQEELGVSESDVEEFLWNIEVREPREDL